MAITGLPLLPGNQVATPIVLSATDTGANDLSISLDDTQGFVTATITANSKTNSYSNFGDSISFTGTPDTNGSVKNPVTVSTPYGAKLVNGGSAYEWITTANFFTAPSVLNDVTLKFTNADSLYLGLPGGGGIFSSSIEGTFTSPTLSPSVGTPGATITLESSGDITTPAAVNTYDLTLKHQLNGVPTAKINLTKDITVTNNFSVESKGAFVSTGSIQAGGTVTVAAGTISKTAVVTGGTGVSITGGTGVTTTGATTSTTGDVSLTATTGIVTLDKAFTATAGNVSVTASNGDLDTSSATFNANKLLTLKSTLGSVTVGTVTAGTGITVTGKNDVTLTQNITAATGDVTLTATVGQFDAATKSITATAGKVDITAGTISKTAVVTGGTGVSITGGTGVMTTGATTATTGDVSLTATTGDISLGAAVHAVTGKATIKALTGTITAHDAITSSGDLTINTKNSFTAVAKTLSSTAGAIAVTVASGTLDVSPATLNASTTLGLTSTAGSVKVGLATSGSTATITGNTGVTLADNLTASTGNVVVTATTGAVTGTSGKTIAATVGNVSLAAAAGAVSSLGTLTAGGTVAIDADTTSTTAVVTGGTGVSITGGTGVTTTGATTATTGDVLLTATTGDIDLSSISATIGANAGGITLSAAQGKVTVGTPLLAGKAIDISSLNTYTSTKSLTSQGGDVKVQVTGVNQNVDLSDLSATIVVNAGKLTLAATNGSINLNTDNPLVALNDVSLSSLKTLSVLPVIQSNAGNVSLSATAGNIGVGNSLRALGGQLTLSAAGVIDGGNAVLSVVQANIFKATANGALGTAPSFAFTNPANDVNTVDIDLSTLAGNPIGTGIQYVDANAVTVTNAVTQTGVIKIHSMGGALSVDAPLGTLPGQTLTGVNLQAADAVTLAAAGGILVSGNGDVQLTSDTNAISVLGSITVANGNVGLASHGAISVNGTNGIAINGLGNLTATANSDSITIAGPLTAANGTVSLTSGGGLTGVTVGEAIIANGFVTISGVTGVSVNDTILAASGNLSLTSTKGPIVVSDNVEATSGNVNVNATAGLVTLKGNVTAGSANTNDASLSAGTGLVVDGDVTAGRNCEFEAVSGISLGTLGINSVVAIVGNVSITTTAGSVNLNADITASSGAITVTTVGQVIFNGGSLVVGQQYQANPVKGLIQIDGTAGVTVSNSATLIRGGRLEINGAGGGAISLMNNLNEVSSLKVVTAGNFGFVNAIPLSLTDFDATIPSVQISAFNVDINSPLGLRVLDGVKYGGSLTLSTNSVRGVEFVPSSTTDNAAANSPFAGTLRDILGYVNANAAANQPMSVVFDEGSTSLALAGEITLDASLPTVAKPITFDGQLLTQKANISAGGIVGIRGDEIGVGLGANGLTLGTGSTKSTVRNAAFSGFGGAGISVSSSDNLLEGLLIGSKRDGTASGNAVGIDLFGSTASRNTIGINTIGVNTGNVIVNNTNAGVRIRSGASYTSIYGNFIGVTQAGVAAGNQSDGVSVEASIGTTIGSTQAVLANTISNNSGNGVRISNVYSRVLSYATQVIGNTIATNTSAGVLIEGGGKNLIGGSSTASANTISGNRDGVKLAASLVSATKGNFLVGNTINGNTNDGVALDLGYANTIDGNTVSNNESAGIRVTGAVASKTQAANQIVRNTVEMNGPVVGATASIGGIVLSRSGGQSIGGSSSALANTVRLNFGSGIVILNATGPSKSTLNVVEYNYVGVTSTGEAGGNTFDGIRVERGITNTIRNNIVRNNAANGISLIDAVATTAAFGNTVASNVVANNTIGIQVAGGANNRVGGVLASSGNSVFANTSDGIVVEFSAGTGSPVGTRIQNNAVGRDSNNGLAGNTGYGIRLSNAQGTTVDYANVVVNNTRSGIFVQGGRSNTIGSTIAGRSNKIELNTESGVEIKQPDTAGLLTQAIAVVGNEISNNVQFGINVLGARSSGITIGRTPSIAFPNGSENTIRSNALGGVRVDAATSVTIVGNQIVNNALTPDNQIILLNNGNGGIQAPVIVSATKRVSGQRAPQYDVKGTIAGTAGQRMYVDLYGNRTSDGRQFFLGRVLVRISTDGTGSFRVFVGPAIKQAGAGGVDQIVGTATLATALTGGTSAFSVPKNL